MNILVTGGAGFIGSHACEHFLAQGHQVVAVDNLSRFTILGKAIGDPLYNWNRIQQLGATAVKGDVRDSALMNKLVASADAIIHTAAQTAVTTSMADPRLDFEINALGTLTVLEAARLAGTRPGLVFCSTNKVYGHNVNTIPVADTGSRYAFSDPAFSNGIPETFSTDHCEHTPYGASKLAADLYVQDYAQRGVVDAGVFRMSCIYGPRQFGVEDQGWVSWFAIAALTGKPLTIYGDGKQVRDVLFVDDLIAAYDAFLSRRTKLRHTVVNMGGGPAHTLSLLELLELLEAETGKKLTPAFADWRPSDQKVFIADTRKAEQLLSWQPKVAPKEGVARMTSWVKQNLQLFK